MEINVEFTDKQLLALEYLNDAETSEILFGGSAGGGKTFLGASWLIMNCIKYPGTKWLMGRSKLKSLKQTTLATFFDICKMWNLTQEHYNYNQQSGEITFYNNSIILLKDLFLYPSDPNFDSLGSLEITGAFIDEVNQICEKAKMIVSSRIRYKLSSFNLTPKTLMTCNPAKNWCYSEFYKKDKEGRLEDYKKFIHALVTDNKYISGHYISQLKKLDDISKRRLLFGEWEYEDKEAIINYDNIINIFKDYNFDYQEDIDVKNYYISCDVARKGKDKAVIILWYNFAIIEMKIMNISLITDIHNYINNLKNLYKINNRNIVIDGDGVGGGLADMLKGCVDFVNNSKALNNDNYQNLKTQCYYKLAEMINDNYISIYNINIEEKEIIIEELSTIKRKNIDKDTKLQIISKEEIKKLIGHSPDFADAMMMRMYFTFKKKVQPITFRI